MASDENKVLRLKVYHQVMGLQNLELNTKDNFSDLRVLLLESTPLTIFENFRFQLANKILPQFQQIGQVIQSDAKINIVLQPFDEKSILYHLQKVKNILANPLLWALLNHNRDQEEQLPQLSDSPRQILLKNITIENFSQNQFTSPLCLPLSNGFSGVLEQKQELIVNLNGENKEEEKEMVGNGQNLCYLKFLELFTFSQFSMSLNSPNYYHRKLAGDFFYLHIRTLEARDYHITACAEGFYLNSSTNTHFNPSPANPYLTYYNLLDLLKTISPKFRTNLNKLKQIKFNQIQKSIFSSFHIKPHLQCNNQWLRPQLSSGHHSKTKNPQLYNFNSKNNPLCQSTIKSSGIQSEKEIQKDSLIIKDWNQIIQIHTVSSYDLDVDMINKNKFKFKLHLELENSVREGAIKLVEGIIPAFEESKRIRKQEKLTQLANIDRKVYRYGSLQFWVAEEPFFAYHSSENDLPSKRKISTEINNLQIVEKLKINDLHFRHHMLIKYKGYCIAAKTIIPSDKSNTQKHYLLQSQQKQKQYIFESISKQLKLSSKTLFYADDESLKRNQISKAAIHPDLEVHCANDGRKYLLNLSALSARDLNFAGAANTACCLRRQLISLYENQYPNSKFHKISINTMIESQYKIIQNQRTKQQRLKLIELARFAREIMVPNCLKSFQTINKKYLGDSKSVVKIMHSFGLSSRYLGMLWKLALNNLSSPHIAIVLERVSLVKSLKSIIRKAMRQNKSGQLKSLLTWIFNCIFNSEYIYSNHDKTSNFSLIGDKQDNQKDESQTTHSKKRKRKNDSDKNLQKDFDENYYIFKVSSKDEDQNTINIGVRPEEIWKLAQKISHFKFGVEFKEDCINDLRCFSSGFSKSAILRDLCISLGIVIERVEYFKKDGFLFKSEHILDLKPIVKHVNIQNQHFEEMLKQADKLLQVKKIQEAIDAYIKSIHFSMLNMGVMTDKFVLAHKKLSEIYFRIGEIDAAILFGHHGEKLLEKFYGLDHIETLEIYSMLSQLYFMKRKFNVAQYYLLKMLNISLVSYGEEYPQIIPSYLNLSTIYQVSEKFIDSISCAVKALNLSLKIFGQNNINTAICYAAMSQIHFEIPDIQKSITFQKRSIQILKKIIKESDNRIKEAETTLEFYKGLQNSKKVKECHQKQRKRISNSQLYANFPLFKIPEYTWKQRQNIFRRMQNTFWNPSFHQFN